MRCVPSDQEVDGGACAMFQHLRTAAQPAEDTSWDGSRLVENVRSREGDSWAIGEARGTRTRAGGTGVTKLKQSRISSSTLDCREWGNRDRKISCEVRLFCFPTSEKNNVVDKTQYEAHEKKQMGWQRRFMMYTRRHFLPNPSCA